jgi:hypothetical protein
MTTQSIGGEKRKKIMQSNTFKSYLHLIEHDKKCIRGSISKTIPTIYKKLFMFLKDKSPLKIILIGG